jgi:hypothetical protein
MKTLENWRVKFSSFMANSVLILPNVKIAKGGGGT